MPGYLDPPPLAFAHRGGSKVADNVGIENSLAAFAHAYRLGFRYLETDVRSSSDGIVYAIHDAALDRLTGSSDSVSALTAEALDLQRLDQREPFARLEALYETFPDARLNIDLKSDDVVESTCSLIEALGTENRTLLASFSYRRLRRVRKRLRSVATSGSSVEVAAVRLLPTWVLKLFGPKAPVCLQVPATRGRFTVVTPRFLQRAHTLGMQVHVWTIDDADQMNRLLDLGVDGIVTDRTDVLKDVLVARGTWREPR
ncbi:glycerophosphodiester phosphodiesterase family protein [Aeromicrobium sp. P5_D10]